MFFLEKNMALPNLAVRAITSVVGVPAIVSIILFAPAIAWKLIILLTAIVCLYEMFDMISFKYPQFKDLKITGIVLGTIISSVILFKPQYLYVMPTFLFIVTATYFLFYFKDMATVIERMGYLVIGVLYVSFLTPFIGLMIESYKGRYMIFLVFMITWGNDTFAYFSGKTFGKHKLYEKMSPKKTIEGSIGGLIGGLGLALVAKFTFLTHISIVHIIAVSIIAGVMGQIGDLVESMFKRYFGVKDSGKIIPGHGGMLDRIDAVMFTAPVIYYYFVFIG